MKKIKSISASLVIVLALSACTKDKNAAQEGVDGKPLISSASDPQLVVVETEVDVPKKMRAKIKRTDLLIWDLRDGAGELLAGNILPVPTFPYRVSVTARQLRKGIPADASLIFSARIVKFGEESKPPFKGQLHVSIGHAAEGEAEVVNSHVDEKRLAEWMKKTNFVPLKELFVGSKVKADFGPILF